MTLNQKKAFTLVELLVVIAIIGMLAGIFIVGVGYARTNAKVRATKALLKQLQLAIDNYQSDFRRYPPSSLDDIGVSVENNTNLGIESLMACLLTQRKNGHYFKDYDSNRLKNYDKDSVPNFNDSVNSSGEAYEYVDPWGNPLVYIHSRDYQQADRVGRYLGNKSYSFTIKAARDPKTKNFFNISSFQLWSIGPNGKNENGEGDDIPVW